MTNKKYPVNHIIYNWLTQDFTDLGVKLWKGEELSTEWSHKYIPSEVVMVRRMDRYLKEGYIAPKNMTLYRMLMDYHDVYYKKDVKFTGWCMSKKAIDAIVKYVSEADCFAYMAVLKLKVKKGTKLNGRPIDYSRVNTEHTYDESFAWQEEFVFGRGLELELTRKTKFAEHIPQYNVRLKDEK